MSEKRCARLALLGVTFLQWLCVAAPARACARAEENQGRGAWIYFPVSFGPLVLGGLAGRALGWTVGDIPRGAASGVALGLLLPLMWWGYVGLFAAVQWIKGRPYESLAGTGWRARQRHWYDR